VVARSISFWNLLVSTTPGAVPKMAEIRETVDAIPRTPLTLRKHPITPLCVVNGRAQTIGLLVRLRGAAEEAAAMDNYSRTYDLWDDIEYLSGLLQRSYGHPERVGDPWGSPIWYR